MNYRWYKYKELIVRWDNSYWPKEFCNFKPRHFCMQSAFRLHLVECCVLCDFKMEHYSLLILFSCKLLPKQDVVCRVASWIVRLRYSHFCRSISFLDSFLFYLIVPRLEIWCNLLVVETFFFACTVRSMTWSCMLSNERWLGTIESICKVEEKSWCDIRLCRSTFTKWMWTMISRLLSRRELMQIDITWLLDCFYNLRSVEFWGEVAQA